MRTTAIEHVENNSAQGSRSAPISSSGRASGLWSDASSAREELPVRAENVLLPKAGRDLIESGFSIIPRFQDCKLIAEAKRDYDSYLTTCANEAKQNRDELGLQFRLANFHMYSEAAMKPAKNPDIMSIIDLGTLKFPCMRPSSS